MLRLKPGSRKLQPTSQVYHHGTWTQGALVSLFVRGKHVLNRQLGTQQRKRKQSRISAVPHRITHTRNLRQTINTIYFENVSFAVDVIEKLNQTSCGPVCEPAPAETNEQPRTFYLSGDGDLTEGFSRAHRLRSSVAAQTVVATCLLQDELPVAAECSLQAHKGFQWSTSH